MDRLGANYDNAAAVLHVKYDDIEQPMSDILDHARLVLNDQQFGTVQRNVYDVLDKASQNGGVVNGEQFSNIKKTLDGLSGGSDSDVAEVGRDLREVMNNGLLTAAKASGNDQWTTILQKTNQQWRNMRTLEGAIDKTGGGDISPARVANIMAQKANRSVSIYGKGDTALSDLAKAANALIPDKVGNSGTATRLATLAVPAAIGGLGSALYNRDWKAAGLGVGAGVAAPYVAQRLLNAQTGKRAIDALGAFGRSPSIGGEIGGAIQKAPLAGLSALRPAQKKTDSEDQ
jgi:hypothetical protein